MQPLLFAQVLLLAGPVMLCLRVGVDPNATAAVGELPLIVALILPALALVHLKARRGKEAPGMVCFVICLALIVVVGTWIGYWASLASPECWAEDGGEGILGAPQMTEQRQEAFEESVRHSAAHFYAECLDTILLNVSSLPEVEQAERFRGMTVHKCPGYEDLSAAQPELRMLELREATFGCSGLCQAKAPIWSPYKADSPACGPILDLFLMRIVARSGWLAANWALLCLLVVFALGVRIQLLKNGEHVRVLRL